MINSTRSRASQNSNNVNLTIVNSKWMNSVTFWIYYIFYELFTSQMAKQDKRHKTASTGACSRCTPPQHYPPHLHFEPPVEPKLPLQMQKLQLSPSLHIPSVGVADDPNASNANFTNPAPIPKNNPIKSLLIDSFLVQCELWMIECWIEHHPLHPGHLSSKLPLSHWHECNIKEMIVSETAYSDTTCSVNVTILHQIAINFPFKVQFFTHQWQSQTQQKINLTKNT